MWPEKPSVVAGFSDMTTFYPDGGRDTQGQEISVRSPDVYLNDGVCTAYSNILLVTAGGTVPMSGGDMRRWNSFDLSETHQATFTSATVQNPTNVTGSFEFAAYDQYSNPSLALVRNYTITISYGTGSRVLATGRYGGSPQRVEVEASLSAGIGATAITFSVTLSGGSGWLASEYVLFNGGTITTSGRSMLERGSALLLAVGR